MITEDGDGIANGVEGAGDADSDGVPNSEDLDSDNDGMGDAVEGTVDADSNGTPDYVEVSTNPCSKTQAPATDPTWLPGRSLSDCDCINTYSGVYGRSADGSGVRGDDAVRSEYRLPKRRSERRDVRAL